MQSLGNSSSKYFFLNSSSKVPGNFVGNHSLMINWIMRATTRIVVKELSGHMFTFIN